MIQYKVVCEVPYTYNLNSEVVKYTNVAYGTDESVLFRGCP